MRLIATATNLNPLQNSEGHLIVERRLQPRKPVAMRVYIYGPGQSMRRAQTVNLSSGGVFVKTGFLGFPRGTPIELVFVAYQGKIIKTYRFPAIVAHISRIGAGMMLKNRKRVPIRMERPASS